MSNLTLLEIIFIIYIIVVNVLGVISIIMAEYASKKASDTIFIILFGVAIPITLPIVLYLLTFDKLKRRKREQDLEKDFNEWLESMVKTYCQKDEFNNWVCEYLPIDGMIGVGATEEEARNELSKFLEVWGSKDE